MNSLDVHERIVVCDRCGERIEYSIGLHTGTGRDYCPGCEPRLYAMPRAARSILDDEPAPEEDAHA